MKRTLIHPDLEQIPSQFHSLFEHSNVYDSSSSEIARVFYINKDQGYFLKTAPSGSLRREADMTRFFHRYNLAAEVLVYYSEKQDWLLTPRIPGEDCVHSAYLAEPERLCDTLAELLWKFHQIAPQDCPVDNLTEPYLETAVQNYNAGIFDPRRGCSSASEAWTIVEQNKHLLKADTLIHGDYCLPNIILDNWKFSGYIDVDHGGIGDRHVDIYWALWSLNYNLKTDRYKNRFLDAYGRSKIDLDALRTISAIEALA